MVYNGWIKIHRQLLDWEWYTDANTIRLFLHLLLTVNIEERKWRGITIKRGELVTSVGSLGEQLNLSSHQIRLSLDKLKSTEEIAIKTTNKYSIVTICKFDAYQSEENQNGNQNGKQMANKWQTNDKQTATIKEYNNIRIKEGEKEKAEKSATRSQFSKPTIEECFSYCKELGLSTYDYDGNQKSAAQVTAEKFWDYFNSNGWKVGGKAAMKDWKSALRNWVRRDAEYNAKRPKSGEQQEREKEFYYQLYDQTK